MTQPDRTPYLDEVYTPSSRGWFRTLDEVVHTESEADRVRRNRRRHPLQYRRHMRAVNAPHPKGPPTRD